MNYDQAAGIERAIERVRKEVAGVSTILVWAFIAALAVIPPSEDVPSAIDGCQAESIGYRVALDSRDYFITHCMSGKGYALKTENSPCPITVFTQSCYEKRGWWRSIKVQAAAWWDSALGLIRNGRSK
jgi:hypothetical protein